jgi:hypothetical protein
MYPEHLAYLDRGESLLRPRPHVFGALGYIEAAVLCAGSLPRGFLAVEGMPLGYGLRAVMVVVLIGRQPLQVLWTVVGPDSVNVMDMLGCSNGSVKDAVLQCLDILLNTNQPAETDVPIAGQVAPGGLLGDSLAGRQLPN